MFTYTDTCTIFIATMHNSEARRVLDYLDNDDGSY